jgi:colanic acid biosynthesis glycosyl transferase WcaI
MRFLLLNQCFYPDVVSTAQHLTDLAVALEQRGHEVTVIAGDRGYDDPTLRFSHQETWNGIRIIRIPSLNLGKKSRWRRALNFGSFLVNCAAQLLMLRRFDVVVALTSPPLISFFGSLFVRLKGGRFFFWVMDLNPDEALAAGWLKENSMVANLLAGLLRYSLRTATSIIVLDRFMKERILAKGISAEKILVLPPWSHDDAIRFDSKGREAFRARHGLREKFVVMYSGNHSPCHPLDTLLEAASRLSIQPDIAFCFVGGGSEQTKVKLFAEQKGLTNVLCLPYQARGNLAGSLSAADLHVIVMGDPFVGIVHPCKVYNILQIGISFLYIGPEESHLSDIVANIVAGIVADSPGQQIYCARHGGVDTVVQNILQAFSRSTPAAHVASEMARKYGQAALLPRMIEALEGPAESTGDLTKTYQRVATPLTSDN